MSECDHRYLSKLDDETWKGFPSFKDGYRFYRCTAENCGKIFKAKVTALHERNTDPHS